MEKKKPKYISEDDALIKLQWFCVYQDRCHKEVRNKLIELGIYGEALERIIVALIQENFLNEERFAQSYARGKFRMKRWGRYRIKRELKFRNISAYCIKKAMQEIDEDEYMATLYALLEKKNATEREPNFYKRRNKLATYLINKGYESHLVWAAIKEVIVQKK